MMQNNRNTPTTGGSTVWLPIPGWEGLYEASNTGYVRSVDRLVLRKDGKTQPLKGRVLKGVAFTKQGHHRIDLSRGGVITPAQVHRMVALTHIGPCPEGMEVCHIDGDGTNNHVSNLRYGTRSENMYDAVSHGTHHQSKKTHCPRGHALSSPNLMNTYGRPSRSCRACHNAKNYIRNKPHLREKFAEIANQYHATIVETQEVK